MSVLQQEVDRMQSIVEEFLTFSRPLVPLNKTRTNIYDLCRDVVTLHDGIALRKHISLNLNPAPNISAELSCDSRKLTQVIINLVQNALEAVQENGNIDINLSHPGKNQIAIEVEDNGPGLEPSIANKLFSAGATTKEKGSGLGLTIARGIAEQHNGSLSLSNGAQGGCIATLMLPLVDKDNED